MSLPELKMDGEVRQFSNRISLDEKIGYTVSKRMMDIVGACFGLIFFFPLFLFVGVLIKAEDPKGSVFYSQTRIGKNGKSFRMYKFRSMVSNADQLLEGLIQQNEAAGAMFKIKEDPRITRIGKWIRKTSIDELPQFWNVLRGEMSLVGPRPPLPREVEHYTSHDKQRLLITPGCTGLWQVTARNSVGFDEMVELDLQYINERSLWLDVSLIFRTLNVMLNSKDAF